MELVIHLLYRSDFCSLADAGPGPCRRAGKCRGGQARVGVAIVRGVRAALDFCTEERETRVQRLAGDDLQVQLPRLGCGGVGFKLGDFVLAITDAHVAAGDEFQVIADQLGKPFPQSVRAIGQFQLAEESPLASHVAEIHATGVLADQVAFQQGHRVPTLAQENADADPMMPPPIIKTSLFVAS